MPANRIFVEIYYTFKEQPPTAYRAELGTISPPNKNIKNNYQIAQPPKISNPQTLYHKALKYQKTYPEKSLHRLSSVSVQSVSEFTTSPAEPFSRSAHTHTQPGHNVLSANNMGNIYITHRKVTTKTQSKMDCYLALNHIDTSRVSDSTFRKTRTRYQNLLPIALKYKDTRKDFFPKFL